MKKFFFVLLSVFLFSSCVEEIEPIVNPISNPFLGSWYCNENFFDNGVTVYSNVTLTFFKDFTYTVEAKLSTYNASRTYTWPGEYGYEDDKIWLDDDNCYFGDGSGYFKYQILDNVLKISAKSETKIFRR